MATTRKEIEFGAGNTIESAVKQLEQHKERGELVYGIFKGQKLYSDTDDMDSAYQKVTGATKAEFDEAARIRRAEWIEKGNAILDEKYHEDWATCVPIRLNDLYDGMELGHCLEIIEQLNANESFVDVKATIEGQGHSGMSFGLVCSMVKSFCDRGADFVAYVRL